MSFVLSRLARTASSISFLRGRPTHYLIRLNNFYVGLKRRRTPEPSGLQELDDVRKRSMLWSDISDHLVMLFTESLYVKPQLIVELGTRGGESTSVLESVAKLSGAYFVCVDIKDCSSVLRYERSIFFQGDDIAFASHFQTWCTDRGVRPVIDVLFIDTSHKYEHTYQEIEKWFPFVGENGRIFLHDTNLQSSYTRKDGSMGMAWDNNRGVMAALEKHLGHSFDEKIDFVDFRNGWLIKHYSACNGFTILERLVVGSDAQPAC